jgi:hypothetical protein
LQQRSGHRTQFSANDTPRRFTIVATSSYGTASFSMTNTSAGVAATVTATGGSKQSATVGATYANALTAKVTDSAGQSVQGAPVTFTLASGSKGADATFSGGGPSTNATTNSSGLATSPPLTANTTAGSFSATAATPGVTTPASYTLTNKTNVPASITAGAGGSDRADVGYLPDPAGGHRDRREQQPGPRRSGHVHRTRQRGERHLF